MFKKAMSYVVWYLLRKTPDPEAKIAVSISHLASDDRVRLTVASRTTEIRAEELQVTSIPSRSSRESSRRGPEREPVIREPGGRSKPNSRGEVSFTASLPAAGQP
jgi:hypothetical protein